MALSALYTAFLCTYDQAMILSPKLLLTGDVGGKKSTLVLLPQRLNDLHESIQVFGSKRNRDQRSRSCKPQTAGDGCARAA